MQFSLLGTAMRMSVITDRLIRPSDTISFNVKPVSQI